MDVQGRPVANFRVHPWYKTDRLASSLLVPGKVIWFKVYYLFIILNFVFMPMGLIAYVKIALSLNALYTRVSLSGRTKSLY